MNGFSGLSKIGGLYEVFLDKCLTMWWYYANKTIINGVEKRIKARLEKVENANEVVFQEPGERVVKTVSRARVKPFSDSIVNPCRDIVLKLWRNGSMHPILVEQGYEGSQNAIYQFILKIGKENSELVRNYKSLGFNI